MSDKRLEWNLWKNGPSSARSFFHSGIFCDGPSDLVVEIFLAAKDYSCSCSYEEEKER